MQIKHNTNMEEEFLKNVLKEIWGINNPTKEDIEYIKENKLSYKKQYDRFNKQYEIKR